MCVHTHLHTPGEWAAQQSLPAVRGHHGGLPAWVSGPGAPDLKLLWAHTLLGVRPRSSEAASGPGRHTQRAPLVAQTIKREKHSRLPRDRQPLRPLGNESQGSTDARLPPRRNITHAGHPSCRLLAAQVPFSSLQPSLHPRQEPGTRALCGLFLRWLPVPGAPPLGHNQDSGTEGAQPEQGRGAETPCPLPAAQRPSSTQRCPAHHQLTPHTGRRVGWITYLKFTVFLSLFGSLLITGLLRTRKSKHFRWNGVRWAGTHSATIRTVRVYKTSQIFKQGFLAQSKCTTRVPLSDQHLRKRLTALGEKEGAVGSTQPPPHHHPGTFLQFHCWRKVSGGSFPVGAQPAHRFSQVGLQGSSGPGKHCPTRPGGTRPVATDGQHRVDEVAPCGEACWSGHH